MTLAGVGWRSKDTTGIDNFGDIDNAQVIGHSGDGEESRKHVAQVIGHSGDGEDSSKQVAQVIGHVKGNNSGDTSSTEASICEAQYRSIVDESYGGGHLLLAYALHRAFTLASAARTRARRAALAMGRQVTKSSTSLGSTRAGRLQRTQSTTVIQLLWQFWALATNPASELSDDSANNSGEQGRWGGASRHWAKAKVRERTFATKLDVTLVENCPDA